MMKVDEDPMKAVAGGQVQMCVVRAKARKGMGHEK